MDYKRSINDPKWFKIRTSNDLKLSKYGLKNDPNIV